MEVDKPLSVTWDRESKIDVFTCAFGRQSEKDSYFEGGEIRGGGLGRFGLFLACSLSKTAKRAS